MPKRVHSASDRDDETPHPNSSKRTRKASDLTNLCQELYDTIRSYKSEDGKLLCEHFVRLPSKRGNTDYYSTIKDPIDLTQIQEKLSQNEYEKFEEFLDDFELIFTNAKTFYRKNSNEWKDANELSKYFYSKINSTKTTVDAFYFEEFFTAIYNAEIDDRPIIDIFLYLPSRKIYPDYYLIVTKPIDLKMIAEKIQNHEYQTLEEMENDLLLMISNARKYNDPKSQIYKDACALKKIITSVRNDLESALKSGNERLRLRKRDVLLSAEVASSEYPAEPSDDEILPSTNDDVESDTSSLADEDDTFRTLYNAVKTTKLGAQTLIDPFMKLPNRRFHQDYYEEIKRPIAMSMIKNHIRKGKYEHLTDLVDDLRLMFDNAMQYNQEGSLIYNSAKKLLDVTLAKAAELGYDQTKHRIPSATIKEESLEASPNVKNRSTKKSIKTPEENLQILFNFIREYRENDVGLIAPFLELPSAEEYPDYYETIEQPIDMTMIKEKLDKGFYKRERELVDDLNRMFSNAKIYNVDESYIFKYASRLEQALATKFKTMIQQRKERIVQSNRISMKNSPVKSINTIEEKCFDLISTLKNFTDRHGRILSTPFITLPSKSDYPDYYQIIKRPIDFKRIETRSYPSIDDLISDFHQMFDNACSYNEPGSSIYRDALTLQKLLIDKTRTLKSNEHDVLHIPSLVHELLVSLFIQTINFEDQNGNFLSDSFADLADPMENEPFDIVFTYDLIRQNLEQRRYHRLDVFQEEFFKVFERLRRLSDENSRIYEDSIKLQKHFIHLRNEFCQNGGLLRSAALLFTDERLEEELRREKVEKLTKKPTKNVESDDQDEDISIAAATSTEESSSSKGQTYFLGDFVYIDPSDASNEPTIICIESFQRRNNEDFFSGLQFLRPQETFHSSTQKFLRREVFLTQTIENIAMSKIQGRCFVLHAKDFFKFRPTSKLNEFLDEDVYVCESRYNMKSKTFKKIKSWNIIENPRVQLVPRDKILDSTRLPSTLVHHHGTNEDLLHRSSTSDSSESTHVDRIDKIRQTILYDSVINAKLNENSTIKRDYYEQIVLSPTKFYKVGDYVYVTNIDEMPTSFLILRLEKIWKNNESFVVSGPLFLQPSEIGNRESLIVTTKTSYEREVIKRDGPATQIPVEKIKGKCSVLSLKHYSTYRLTEIAESDVFLCETKYVNDDHSLRSLSKPLKRISLSSRAVPDEIWTFRKELILNPIGSTVEIEDSNDEHSMNSDLINNLNHSNASLLNRTQNQRKTPRRVPSARPPCGYLVFASESRKRLIRDNPGIPFGEMSRIIGDQWRRLPTNEREKFEEKARERAREQPIVVNEQPQRPVNGFAPPVLNGVLPALLKAAVPVAVPTAAAPPPVVARPPRVQRLLHSEIYFRYIEHLKRDHPFISDWPRQLKSSISNRNPSGPPSRPLPSQWFLNNSPGLYNNVYEALWSMRDHMWSDVIRVRNVLSDEW